VIRVGYGTGNASLVLLKKKFAIMQTMTVMVRLMKGKEMHVAHADNFLQTFVTV